MALLVPAVRCLANSNDKVDFLFFWDNKKKVDIKLTHPLWQNTIFDLFSSYTTADEEVLKPIIRENAITEYLVPDYGQKTLFKALCEATVATCEKAHYEANTSVK